MTLNDVLRTQYGSPLWLGSVLGLWGVWLLLPWETFRPGGSWTLLEEFASEVAWGFVMLLGSIRLIQGSWKQDARFVKEGSFVAFWAFFFIFSAFASSNPRGTGVPVYFMLVVLSFYLWNKHRTIEIIEEKRRS